MNADKDIDVEVEAELKKLQQREAEIMARVAQLQLFHEHLVLIHRYEGIETLTFLEVSESTMGSRRRSSWYGKIVAITGTDSGDDVVEAKKKMFKIGDVINFNPDSAWSLNIAGFEEIWALHVDNVLCADKAYDYIKYKAENYAKKMKAQVALATVQMRRAERELRQQKQIQK